MIGVLKKILVVDDSKSIRRMACFCLRDAGYQVTEAVDGVDAMNISQAQHFDLVLTDQNMPRMEGLVLIRHLRDQPAYQNTPILILTNESSDEMKAKGRAVKATGWLVKPFNPEQLLAVVKKIFS